MKNIILTIILVTTLYSCKAQTIYPLGTHPDQIQGDNYYIKDTENIHDQIVGVWRWEDGNSSFEITLQEFEQNPIVEGSTELKDRIFGKYKYILNGLTVVEVDNIPNLIQNSPKVILFYKSANIYKIQISDILSGKRKFGELTLNPNETITMILQDPIGTSGIRTLNDPPPNNLEFQLPTNITLTKVE